MKKILPLDHHPIVETYQMRAYELGAIGAYLGDIRPWLCDKFISGTYTPGGKFVFDFNTGDRWFAAEGATLNEQFLINNYFFDGNVIDWIPFIETMINRDYYFVGFYNERYIPDKWAYQESDFDHDFLVYGYDSDERIFYSCGYRSDGHYGKLQTSYDELIQGITHTVAAESYIDFYKINTKHAFSLNLKSLCNKLWDYLHSTDRRYPADMNRYYGLDAERFFSDYLQFQSDNKCTIDMRYPRVFWELKKVMDVRLGYLQEIGYLRSNFREHYASIAEKSRLIFLLCLKYNITKDPAIVARMVELNNEIIRDEEPIIWDLYKTLSSRLDGVK